MNAIITDSPGRCHEPRWDSASARRCRAKPSASYHAPGPLMDDELRDFEANGVSLPAGGDQATSRTARRAHLTMPPSAMDRR